MTGKTLKIASNDLYGNVDDRIVNIYACFQHSKYMNNYVVFSFEGDNKLCFGSVHMKEKSLVIFSVKEEIKKYILQFLDEYVNNRIVDFNVIDISNISKIELVSYNEMEYENILLLDSMAIPRVINSQEIVHEKKPVLLYILIIILLGFAMFITLLYFKPDLFSIKYKKLECNSDGYDELIKLNFNIYKEIKFDNNDKVKNISIIKTYTFLDNDSYDDFKDNSKVNDYFNNGEGYKYIDEELKLKLFYEEDSVIDDYEEMLTYLTREGYSCVEIEYEE